MNLMMKGLTPVTLRTRRTGSTIALAAVPIFFGLVSIVVGQDAGWDLLNYHVYTPYAFLTGRLGVDLAPASLQTYFNPTLDIPYYWGITHFPARSVAFAIGAVHGLCFSLLFLISGCFLDARATSLRAALALAGCLGPLFVSELGTVMGDASTAVLVLAALWSTLRARTAIGPARGLLLLAGLLAGAAMGLKLANAPYVIGTVLAVVLTAATVRRTLVDLIVCLSGFALAFSVTGGHWLLRMYLQFGNPFFPQFNNVFKSEWASTVTIHDKRFMLRGVVDALTLPYQMLLDPLRVSEQAVVAVAWPIVYSLLLLLLARHASRRIAGHRWQALEGMAPQDRVLIAFIAGSFVAWAAAFGIARYLLAMECLLPLTIFVLMRRLQVPKAAPIALAIAALVVAGTVFRPIGWGHARYATENFSVETPTFASPDTTTFVVGDEMISWVIPFLPKAAVYVGVENGFPYSQRSLDEVHRIIQSRAGDVYLLLNNAQFIRRKDPALTASLEKQGLAVIEETCKVRAAYVGSKSLGYQLCKLGRVQ